MKEFKRIDLQLFADGAEGGADGGDAPGEAIETGEEIPSDIPDHAKEIFRKAQAKMPKGDTRGKATEQVAEEAKPTHVAYADLIKSDEYKEEHKAYMDKTIGDRLKKYKGLEERQSKSDELLGLVAQKYGLDSASETFLDDLKSKVESDDSIYESYAMEHNVSTDEAKRMVDLERKVAQAEMQRKADEMQRAEAEKQAEEKARYDRLFANAERTKAQYPNFNLEVELQNPAFARMCAVTNEDTTAAYIACHHDEILKSTAQYASQQAQIQTANAIKSGQNRPRESGLSNGAPAIVEQDFSKMNLQQLRQYAEEQRRKR